MNIYEIQVGNEKDWICANTIFQVLKFYHSINDLEFYDFDDNDDIIIVPESEWKNHNIIDIENSDENGEYIILQTFEEYMETAIVPDIIATTCW